tara:strand:+ start:35 stop:508 length:474 start_codon:yes stop_codon:yes gene_type:complete
MLVGKNISLRSLIDSDLDFLERIENNDSLWKYGSEQKKYTRDELKSYIQNSDIPIQISKQYRFVIDFQTVPVGFIDLFNFKEKEVFIGIIIDDLYQNRGFAKEALSLLTDYCLDYLNITQLKCSVDFSNKKSNSLFLKSGFQFVYKKNNFNFYIFVR